MGRIIRCSQSLYHLKVGSSCQDLGPVYASFRWFAGNGYKVSDELLQQSLADMPKQTRQERQDGSVAHVTCLAGWCARNIPEPLLGPSIYKGHGCMALRRPVLNNSGLHASTPFSDGTLNFSLLWRIGIIGRCNLHAPIFTSSYPGKLHGYLLNHRRALSQLTWQPCGSTKSIDLVM